MLVCFRHEGNLVPMTPFWPEADIPSDYLTFSPGINSVLSHFSFIPSVNLGWCVSWIRSPAIPWGRPHEGEVRSGSSTWREGREVGITAYTCWQMCLEDIGSPEESYYKVWERTVIHSTFHRWEHWGPKRWSPSQDHTAWEVRAGFEPRLDRPHITSWHLFTTDSVPGTVLNTLHGLCYFIPGTTLSDWNNWLSF